MTRVVATLALPRFTEGLRQSADGVTKELRKSYERGCLTVPYRDCVSRFLRASDWSIFQLGSNMINLCITTNCKLKCIRRQALLRLVHFTTKTRLKEPRYDLYAPGLARSRTLINDTRLREFIRLFSPQWNPILPIRLLGTD